MAGDYLPVDSEHPKNKEELEAYLDEVFAVFKQKVDSTGKHWYELRIEFESNQWTKQFKGEYKFTKSTAYNDAP